MTNGTSRAPIRGTRAACGPAILAGVWAMAFVILPCPTPGAASAQERDGQDASTETPGKGPEIPFADVKFLIEHNATDEDTGFQAFVDGEPWNRLTIESPDGRAVLDIRGLGTLRTLGLTELFFETNEPPNAEVPIEELLARFPEGEYEFEGQSVEGDELAGTARLSHLIPAGPRILSPPEGSVVDRNRTVVRWERVTTSITGDPVDIVGYEVIVTDAADVHPPGFSKRVLSAHVSPSTTSLTVPRQFLEPATAYTLEVLALEAGGNQTLSSSAFSTR